MFLDSKVWLALTAGLLIASGVSTLFSIGIGPSLILAGVAMAVSILLKE